MQRIMKQSAQRGLYLIECTSMKYKNPDFKHVKIGANQFIKLCSLLSSRLYCRFWNCTKSIINHFKQCLMTRGLYRRSGISPCPEEFTFILFYNNIIQQYYSIVNMQAIEFYNFLSMGFYKLPNSLSFNIPAASRTL